jgi:multiple antibiotic resistance protein
LISLEFFSSVTLLFLLLNPFLVIIYIIDVVQNLTKQEFLRIIIRAGIISSIVFVVFALTKNIIFKNIIQANFASFQIFGGVIFLIIGIKFVFQGVDAVKNLRGKPKHIVGSLAMPILIGPGSISASIVIGERLENVAAVVAIVVAVFLSMIILILLKLLHDYVNPRDGDLIERYIEIMGRITALVVGTFSIEMIMAGIKNWLPKIGH